MVYFHCLQCGICCTKYWVPLSHLDVFRIDFYSDIDVYDTVVLRNTSLYRSSRRYPIIRFRGHKYYLSLKDVHGKCIFLRDNKCIIHGFKPLACRIYPFKYSVENNSILIDVNEDAVKVCPGLVLDGKPIDKDLWRKIFRLASQRIIELKMYEQAVLEWNEEYSSRYGSLNKLIEFLLESGEKDFKKLVKKGLWMK